MNHFVPACSLILVIWPQMSSFIAACPDERETFGRELRIGATSQRSPSSGPTALLGLRRDHHKTAEPSTGFRGEKREA
jgi:hypothetical protein